MTGNVQGAGYPVRGMMWAEWQIFSFFFYFSGCLISLEHSTRFEVIYHPGALWEKQMKQNQKRKYPSSSWTAQLFLGTGEEASVWDSAKHPTLFEVDQSLGMHGSKHFLSCNSPAHVYLKGNLAHLFLIHLHWTHQKSCWRVLCLAKFSMGFWEIPIYYWILFGVLGLLGFVFTGSPGRVENAMNWSHSKPAELCSSLTESQWLSVLAAWKENKVPGIPKVSGLLSLLLAEPEGWLRRGRKVL